nr:MAG TPA: Protein of unknown function (DUF2634) [Caudoviricetes sp.]
MDIVLKDGDLYISKKGDILLKDSVRQKVQIKIRWILGEWKWNKEEGIDYFGSVFIKNPDVELLESTLREKIFEIDEVIDVKDIEVRIDNKSRKAVILYTVSTEEEIIGEEVSISGKLWGNG